MERQQGDGWARGGQDAVEITVSPDARKAPSRLRGVADEDRPRWLLFLSLTSLLVAFVSGVVVAWDAGGGIFCNVTRRLSGGEIPLAAVIVLGVCAVALFAAIVARQRPFLLVLVLSAASVRAAHGSGARRDRLSRFAGG